MEQIRIHGRGGQGVTLLAEMLAMAFVFDGKESTSFPIFGSERRGGPVSAFVRYDENPILEKTKVYEPDCLILFHQNLMLSHEIYGGFKPGGIFIMNSPELLPDRPDNRIKVLGTIDADKISSEYLGRQIPNTCLLGAFASCTGWLSLDAILASLEEYFVDEALTANKRCARSGFENIVRKEYTDDGV